jgi:hypothetical protein
MTRAMMILFLAAASITACAGCGDGAPAAPAKGKANLRVTVVAIPKTGAKAFAAYQTDGQRAATAADATGDRELVDYEQLEDVVVWLQRGDGATGTAAAPKSGSAERRIPVTHKPAKAPLFAAPLGEAATFENKGSRPLRLYSVSEGNEFDLGQLAPGVTASHRFQSPGLIELLDGETLDVVASVYVVPGVEPRVTRSGQPQLYRDLDPGPWRAAAWHGRLPGGQRTITLVADGVREIDVPIGVNALPKVE